MKRLLLLLLLLATVFAAEVDADTGCEKYVDHLVCPQAVDVEASLVYTRDAECYSVQNELGGLEELGCFVEAELAETLEYENCRMYVPFDTDVLLGEIDYEYQCTTERLPAGESVYLMGFREDFPSCETLEEDEFYGEYVCGVSGQKFAVSGSIHYANNSYNILIFEQETPSLPFADVSSAIILLAVGVLFVYALYVWSERKK